MLKNVDLDGIPDVMFNKTSEINWNDVDPEDAACLAKQFAAFSNVYKDYREAAATTEAAIVVSVFAGVSAATSAWFNSNPWVAVAVLLSVCILLIVGAAVCENNARARANDLLVSAVHATQDLVDKYKEGAKHEEVV